MNTFDYGVLPTMLTAEQSAKIIETYKRSPSDTGSAEVQIALLSANITSLAEHFKKHTKDAHSRRGLLKMINQRRRLMAYLKKTDLERFQTLMAKLKG